MARTRSKAAKTADTIGRSLGRVAARIDSWRQERDELAAQLQDIVQNAQDMLSELRPALRSPAKRAARTLKRTVKRGRRKGRTLSMAARAKMSRAAKKRWATKKKTGAA